MDIIKKRLLKDKIKKVIVVHCTFILILMILYMSFGGIEGLSKYFNNNIFMIMIILLFIPSLIIVTICYPKVFRYRRVYNPSVKEKIYLSIFLVINICITFIYTFSLNILFIQNILFHVVCDIL